MTNTWHPVSRGPVTGVDWPRWLCSDARVDPYLVWADLTRMAGYTPVAGGTRLPILVQFAEGSSRDMPTGLPAADCRPGDTCHPVYGLLDISSAYKLLDAVNDSAKPRPVKRRSDFVTALVLPQCIEELYRCPEMVARFQLGLARVPQVDPAPVDRRDDAQRDDHRVVVGIIDDGYAFAHANFCDHHGVPRTCYIWDQDGDGRGLPWRAMQNYRGGLPGYGAELHWEDIRKLLADRDSQHNQSSRAALSPYATADYVPRRMSPHDRSVRVAGQGAFETRAPVDTMIRAAHGTSVAAMAAGTQPAIAGVSDAQGQWPSFGQELGAPSTWPIIFVQLPTRTSLDTSGGSLGVHVLDGLRYIIDRAQGLGPETRDPKAPYDFIPPQAEGPRAAPPGATSEAVETFTANRILVNISYGAIGGPHDGTSILEEAIADLVAAGKPTTDPRLWVNVAAGNARGSRTACRVTLQEGGAARRLNWTVGADNRTEAYLEVWLPDCDSEGQRLDAAWLNKLSVEVTPPAGLPTLTIRRGEGRYLAAQATGQPLAAAIFPAQVAQGRRGTMLLFSCARTGVERDIAAALEPGVPRPATVSHGTWEICIRWDCSTATRRFLHVHAWAERNDALWGFGRRQQSTIEADEPVPGKTQFSPTVQEFCRRGALAGFTEDVPKPFQAELSSSSLAHIPSASFMEQDPASPFGRAAQVGGWRLADGEMAAYSAAMVTRNAPADRGRLPGGDCRPSPTFERTRLDTTFESTVRDAGPAIDAPSDASRSVPGLRTIGMRDGAVARIGGTSAAAPLVTRHLAFTLDGRESLSDFSLVPSQVAPAPEDVRRPTLTPARDDRFHKGKRRLVPKPRRR